jgi:hypothetical protein
VFEKQGFKVIVKSAMFMVLFLSMNVIRYRIYHGKRAGKRSLTALPINPARSQSPAAMKARVLLKLRSPPIPR